MAETRIRLFGALELTHGDAEPQRPASGRVIELLGYLAVHHNLPHSRDKLIDVLWPELDLSQGRRVLSDTLWRTRRLLTPPGQSDTPALVTSGDTITFRPADAVWIDLVAFELYLQCAEAGPSAAGTTQREAAVALYRGDLLADCYADWPTIERTRLRELYLGALQRLLAHYQQLRDYNQALQTTLRLVQADPLVETTHRELMRLYYLLGRGADAIRAFEQCRQLLADELGIEPEPETISLYDEIVALQQRKASPLLVASAAEEGATGNVAELPFVGRGPQRAILIEAVEQAIAGAGGMLLVAGVAGIGKSRLLREVAQAAAWRGAEVSWGYAGADTQHVPFGPLCTALGAILTPLRAQQVSQLLPAARLRVLTTLLPQLGAIPASPARLPHAAAAQTAALHNAISELLRACGTIAPQVVILEDAHWFDPATIAALVAVLPHLRDARVLFLASGRADELLQRPVVWEAIQQLDRCGPFQRLDLDDLSPDDCADLLQRALRLGPSSRHLATRLHTLTGGHPFFFLETLRGLHEQGLLRRDASGKWQLREDDRDITAQVKLPQSLQAAIGERIGHLTAAARTLLDAAAVVGQDCTPAIVAQMVPLARVVPPAAPAESTAAVVFPLLHQLVQRQFLVETATGYRFAHDTLREAVYTALAPSECRALHLRAAAALEQTAADAVERLAYHFFAAEAWARALPYLVRAGDQAAAVQALAGAHDYYEQALCAATGCDLVATDRPAVCELQLKRGQVASALGDYPLAAAAYTAALQLANEAATGTVEQAASAELRAVQIRALNGLSMVDGLRNEYVRASTHSRQAIELAKACGGTREQADAWFQAGVISFRIDDFDQARRRLHRALTLYEQLGLEYEQARCLQDIGACYLRQDGPTDQVSDYFRRAITIYRRQDDRLAEHQCRLEIANTYLTRGRLLQVLSTVEECLDYFNQLRAMDEVAWCYFLRGEAARRLGMVDTALVALYESRSISSRMGRDAAALFSQLYIAATLSQLGRYDEALVLLQPALDAESNRSIRVRALLIVAEILLAQDNLEPAWLCLTESLQLAAALGAKAREGIAYRVLAQLRMADAGRLLPTASREYPAAAGCLVRSQDLLSQALYDDELGRTALIFGQLLLGEQRLAAAKAQLIRARVLFWQCGMAALLTQVEQLLHALEAVRPDLLPGQCFALLARQNAVRGRALQADEQVEIVWTVADAASGSAAAQTSGRRDRLRLLCAEAAAQGAEPTVEDLAQALGVSRKTVQRDIDTLQAAGEVVVTRGSAR